MLFTSLHSYVQDTNILLLNHLLESFIPLDSERLEEQILDVGHSNFGTESPRAPRVGDIIQE